MATIKSTLGLNDVMTPTLRKINRAMSMVLDTFEAVQEASGQTFNSASIAAARQEIGQANSLLDAMEEEYKNINNQQNRLNSAIGKGTSAAGGFLGKVKAIGAAFLGMKGVNWIKESLGLSDIQRNAEKQLSNVLNNMGVEKGAFEKLTAKASALQGLTNYGDEALIGGAAEFSTYMQDSDAVAVMMETLTNYAAGMSGGGEVGYEEMVQYATNLGKITTGSFDAMTKKGFEFTDAQKKIIENGSDMEKALTISEVINESWAGLANSMANTPQGKIIQLKNTFGDMREELGTRIYPAVMQLFDTISANSASISSIITGLSKPINLVINVLNKALKAASAVYNFFARNWSKIAPIVGGIVTAVVAYNAALLAHKAYLAGAAVVQGIKTVAEYAHAKAIMATVAAMGSEATAAQLEAAGLTAETVAKASATVAQTSFNTALWACPITWIIALLIALIVVFVMFTEQIMGAIFWLGALFKNIGLWIANCGIAAWAVIKNVGLWFANLGLAIWQVIKNIGAWFGNLGQAVWAVIQNVGAWFGNLGMGVWNVLKAAASNIATAFKNGWIDIQIGFWSMVDVIMQGVKKVAEFANKCLGWMGVNIDTSGLDFAANKVDELNSKKEEYKDISEAWEEGQKTFAYQDVGAAMNTYAYGDVGEAFNTNQLDWSSVGEGFNTFDTFQSGWGSEAYNAGAQVGAGIHDWIDNTVGGLFGGMTGNAFDDVLGYGDTLDGIAGDTSDIADCGNKTSEELAYLRDIAEQEAINRFTTAEIKVDFTSNNTISSDMDVDGVFEQFERELSEAVETAAEGDY